MKFPGLDTVGEFLYVIDLYNAIDDCIYGHLAYGSGFKLVTDVVPVEDGCGQRYIQGCCNFLVCVSTDN